VIRATEVIFVSKRIRVIIGLIVLVLLVGSTFCYQLREGSVSVVTRLGQYRGTETEAGLHFRLPMPIDHVYRFDNRKRVLETSFTETIMRDKKNVILLNYAVWNISNPLRFLESVNGNPVEAERKLDRLITDAKNAVMGNYDLTALVSTEEEDLQVDEIEQAIWERVRQSAETDLGINIEQVALLQVALPEGNITRVFEQMRAERQQYAAAFRAEGDRQGSAIRSATDLESAEIIAEAQETAAGIRAAADAEAAGIYAAAHSLDPDFYRFLRSLEALESILGENTTLVLDTDAPPFDLLED